MKINDFLNDNFIILKTMYDNQVTVLNERQMVLQIERLYIFYIYLILSGVRGILKFWKWQSWKKNE